MKSSEIQPFGPKHFSFLQTWVCGPRFVRPMWCEDRNINIAMATEGWKHKNTIVQFLNVYRDVYKSQLGWLTATHKPKVFPLCARGERLDKCYLRLSGAEFQLFPHPDALHFSSRLLEEGNVEGAEEQKQRIEQLQRERKKVLQDNNMPHQPRFFKYAALCLFVSMSSCAIWQFFFTHFGTKNWSVAWSAIPSATSPVLC